MSAPTSVTQKRLTWGIAEISAVTGLSAGFVRKEIRAGRLAARRAGRRVLVLDHDLKRYLGDAEPKDETL
jgi:excisionase family DNA binding protein